MISLGTYQELSWECTWWYSSIGWQEASTAFHISLSFELQYKNWLFHDDHPSPPLGLGSCSSPQHEWSFGPNSVFGKVQDWSVFWQQWLHKFGLPLIPKSHKGKFPRWSRYKLSLVGFLWQHSFLPFWSVSKPSKEWESYLKNAQDLPQLTRFAFFQWCNIEAILLGSVYKKKNLEMENFQFSSVSCLPSLSSLLIEP